MPPCLVPPLSNTRTVSSSAEAEIRAPTPLHAAVDGAMEHRFSWRMTVFDVYLFLFLCTSTTYACHTRKSEKAVQKQAGIHSDRTHINTHTHRK
jgi:hypothetical protein